MQGVLLINLGSPDSPSVPDVRRYLGEFLMDSRVIDAPWPIRFGIVHFAILPKRPKQSAEAYRSIWTAEGSPLITSSRRVQALLQAKLPIPVELAMRYQNPSIESALRALTARGVSEIFVIPLFPHYAMSSFETAAESARQIARTLAPAPRVQVAEPYFADGRYISALVASAQPYFDGKPDHLLFSFHGLPERHIRKADKSCQHCLKTPECCEVPNPAHATCYRAQCFATVREFIKKASGLPASHSIAFQSRLGRDPWLQPYTDHELVRLAKAGVKRIAVICPAFVSDCLETLEEIGMRGKETFLEAGGQEFATIPCLNDHPQWIEALEAMVNRWRATAAAPLRAGA